MDAVADLNVRREAALPIGCRARNRKKENTHFIASGHENFLQYSVATPAAAPDNSHPIGSNASVSGYLGRLGQSNRANELCEGRTVIRPIRNQGKPICFLSASPTIQTCLMSHSVILERIRHFVQQTFAQIDADAPSAIRETILVQNGYYCGRRFTCNELHAVWFVEEGELKFYGPDGAVLKVTDTRAIAGDESRAAA
jgi:hypothetical protein